jgi:hypothetical protein
MPNEMRRGEETQTPGHHKRNKRNMAGQDGDEETAMSALSIHGVESSETNNAPKPQSTADDDCATSATPSAPAEPSQLDIKHFECTVCLCVVYLPVCLPCGHVFCFFCVFQAMDALAQESKCPFCRHKYVMPPICVTLFFGCTTKVCCILMPGPTGTISSPECVVDCTQRLLQRLQQCIAHVRKMWSR